MHLANGSPSFTPVHSRIRAIGPRVLHLPKGRGLRVTTIWADLRASVECFARFYARQTPSPPQLPASTSVIVNMPVIMSDSFDLVSIYFSIMPFLGAHHFGQIYSLCLLIILAVTCEATCLGTSTYLIFPSSRALFEIRGL